MLKSGPASQVDRFIFLYMFIPEPFLSFCPSSCKSGFRAFFLLKHRVEVGWGGVACAAGCMWGSENNLQDSVVSFPVTSQDSDSGCRPPWQMTLPPHLSVPQKPSYVLFFNIFSFRLCFETGPHHGALADLELMLKARLVSNL